MLIYTKKVTILIAIVVVCTLGSLPASASAVPVHVSPLKSVSLAPSVNCKGMSIRACENASATQARANAAAALARANAAAEARQASADQARANQAATQAAAQREANQAAANQARIAQAQAEARQAAADQARANAAASARAQVPAKVPAVTIPASIAVPMIFSPIVALTPSVGAGVTENLGTGIVYEELMPNTYGNNSTTRCTTKSPAVACSPIRQNNAANAEQNFKVIVDTIGEHANLKPIVTVTGFSNYKCEELSAGKNIACGGASARDRANDAANVTKASLAKENPPVTSTIVSNASMCAAIKTQVCLVTFAVFDKGEKVAADFAITLPNATTTCCVTPTKTVPATGTPIATPTNGTPIATPTNGTPIVTPTNGTPIVTPTNGTPDNSGGANNNLADPSNGSAGSAPDFSEYPEAIDPDTGEPWVVSLLVDVKVPANYIANGKKTALTATVTLLCGGSPCRSNSLIDSKYETVTMSQKVETGLCSRPTQLNCLYYAPENGKKQVSPATYTMYFYTPSPSARQITTTLSVDAVITRIIPRKDGSAVTVSIDNYRIVYRANGVGASSEISRPVLGSRG